MSAGKLCYLVTHGTAMKDQARVDWLNRGLKYGTVKRVYIKLPAGESGASAMIGMAQKISQHARPYATVRVLRDAKPRYLSIIVEHRPDSLGPPTDYGRAA